MRRHPGRLKNGIPCDAECRDGTRCRALVWYREDRGRCHHHQGLKKPQETASEAVYRKYPMLVESIRWADAMLKETGDHKTWALGPLGWCRLLNQYKQLIREYMAERDAGGSDE